MKFFDLDNHLQQVILNVTKTKARDITEAFVQINRVQYHNIFWQLQNNKELARDEFGKPAAAKQANEMIHQLNNYLLSNRSKLNDVFTIKNPVLIKRLKPPLRQHASLYLPDVDTLDGKLLQNPDFGCPTRVPPGSVQQAKFYLGQLLYTAARFGNLLRKDLLTSLFKSLRHTAPVQHNYVTWFELSGDANEQYPWIPDPISSALLPRYFKLRYDCNWQSDPSFLELKWLSCLHYFLRASSCKSIASLRSKKLFSTLKSRLSITQTPCHLNVATGEEPNMPLTTSGFTRLVGYHHAIQVTDDAARDDYIQITPSSSSLKTPAQYEHKHLDRVITDCSGTIKLVKKALSDYHLYSQKKSGSISDDDSAKSLKELSSALLAIARDPSLILLPVTKLLIEWAAMRLVSQNKWTSKLKPNSIVTYLGHIFIPMTRIFSGHDIVANLSRQSLQKQQSWNITDLDEYYLEVIDEAPSNNSQLMRAKILRDFHLFLEKAYNIEPSYVCSTIVMQACKRQPSMVDASILLPRDYQQTCDILLKRATLSLEPASDYIPLILLVLGFRCGLRRHEALFLRASDIETPGATSISISPLTELLVRPFAQRKLKSKAAERRLPLGQLFNENEIEWFNNFLTLRKQAGPIHFLFCTSSLEKPADADTVFLPLVNQLKLVTQDAGFRYHRLRHSFVTWAFWYWQQHKYPTAHPLSPLLQHEAMLHLIQARQRYFNQVSNNAIRGELHAISVMAGHSSPSMTLLHYLHSLHWCQSAEAWRDYSLNQDVIAKLLAMPRRTYFDQKEKRGLVAVLQEAILPWCSLLPAHPPIDTQSEAETCQVKMQVSTGEIRDFYQVLYKFYVETELFKAPLLKQEESNNGISLEFEVDESVTADALLKYPTLQRDWAEQHYVAPTQFISAVALLKNRLKKTNRARREQKNKLAGTTHQSNISRYELPRWSGKGYGSVTAKLIVQAFNKLTSSEQHNALDIANYIVMMKVASWNNCQFRQPEELWRFVAKLAPLMGKMPNKYYVNIDLLHQPPMDSTDRAALYHVWQKPTEINIALQITHKSYSDAKGKGYAALSVRAYSQHRRENRQGDHGFYIGMTAIYFYFNSLEEYHMASHKAEVALTDTSAPPQFESKQEIEEESQWFDDDYDAITDQMIQQTMLPNSSNLGNMTIDIDRFDTISISNEDIDSADWLPDDELFGKQKPKRQGKKKTKPDDTLGDIDDELV